MKWQEALEILVERTGHVRYRELCDLYPEWRETVIAFALEQPAEHKPKPQTFESCLGAWFYESLNMARTCCGQVNRVPFDAYRDVPVAERTWWPF